MELNADIHQMKKALEKETFAGVSHKGTYSVAVLPDDCSKAIRLLVENKIKEYQAEIEAM